MYLFLDIETYSKKKPTPLDKIIAIGILYRKGECSEMIIFKEWERSEKLILRDFYEFVFSMDSPTIVTFNGLRFDIPALIYRAQLYNLYTLEDLLEFWHSTRVIDLFQILLTENSFRFKGNSFKNALKKYGIPQRTNNKEIAERYEKGDYKYIEEHLREDLINLEKLFWKIWRRYQAQR